MIYCSGTISHHGIKGQRWGVRNGPPYPLRPGDHSVREQKAGYIKSVSKSARDRAKKRSKSFTEPTSEMYNVKAGSVDPETIKMGATIVATLFAVVAPVVAIKKQQQRFKEKYESDIQNNLKANGSFSQIKRIKGSPSDEENVAAINPNYGKEAKYGMNCAMCSATYELRRRGYDVEASTTTLGRDGRSVMKWFNLTENDPKTYSNASEFEKGLAGSVPDGARGICTGLVGPQKFPHTMAWEKQNGTIILRDCQTSKVYNGGISESIYNQQTPMLVFRTDNAMINKEAIMDAVKPRGG